MKMPMDNLLKKALAMPTRERAAIAERLIDSLDRVHDQEVEAAWQDEIQRRMSEVDSGGVRLVPWEEIRARIERV